MADRKEKCQDFTSLSLGRLVNALIGEDENEIYDMCAGCGSLTIQQWNNNKKLRFVCRELDERVMPYLLFNLAVRNIDAVVYRGDVLVNEDYEKYKLVKEEKYSLVSKEEV